MIKQIIQRVIPWMQKSQNECMSSKDNRSKVRNKVFGELNYDYVWSRDMSVDFFGSKVEISLVINGEEDGEFEEEQYDAYQSLMKKWNDLQEMIINSVLNYYNEKRNELGYDTENPKSYPLIETREEMLQNITLTGIVIPYSGTYEGRESGLIFDCTWDVENGLGVYLVDEKVMEVGEQDILM